MQPRFDVRLRAPWEAADLGLALLRRHARAAYGVSALLTLPPALALGWWLRATPWLAPLLLFWLKPLIDRPILHILAQGCFGEAPGAFRALREARAYLRRGVPAQLLWRRIDLERGLMLPVWQLEVPDGRTFRSRRKVMTRRNRSTAQLATLTCLLVTAGLVLVAIALLAYLWPDSDYNVLDTMFGSAGQRSAVLDFGLWLLPSLALAAIEPAYVAISFGLYLNRRVQLEGWDLDLAFRNLAERAQARAGARALRTGLLAALLLVPATLRADPPDPAQAVREVLAEPEFATTRPEWKLRMRNPSTPDRPQPPPRWLLALPGFAGKVLKLLLPVALVGALVWFLWRRRGTLGSALESAPDAAPSHLFGMDVRPGALPKDIPGAALGLWDAGQARAALALLYRGALSHLVGRAHVALGPGATEGDCLDGARAVLADPAWTYLASLTSVWRGVAYGGRPAPPEGRDLCLDWGRHFGGSSR